MKFLIFSTIISALIAQSLGPVDYTNHKLIDIEIKNESDIKAYKNFAKANNIDTWGHIKIGTVKARITPELAPQLEDKLSLPFKVVQENLQTLIDAELVSDEIGVEGLADRFHKSYHTTKEIYDYMDDLIAKSNGLATPITVGHTYQGKKIRGVKITNPKGSNKKAFIMHAGIHAREWITISTATYLMDQIISHSNSRADLKLLVDTFEIIIIPVLNVDGYDYTRENRMWRKNLQPNHGSSCIGIDLNRNWGYKWGDSGTDPCGEDYQGSSAFNTLETKAVSKFLSKHSNTIAYIDIHAYSQLWMHPYGYTCSTPPDNDRFNEIGRVATTAMIKAGGPRFQYGTICNIIYPASGSSVDWAYAVPKIKYPFAVELKDTGYYGFIMPPRAIIPQGREFTAAIAAMGAQIKKNEGL
ncbi:hypothetical protein CONCODRAFT_77883 [Conidiobolus coronatus NRRL 28638]|uniref:Carboxypeptidase M14A n=1 Tax=Conidiobolus coronatus (strain ATCC 28846 / CBS 209.66 / NRRL 28638) TaxID=796925 RepID=A0A137PBB0_CONC2|nr:hypothetical protein CONCODRAFT_77883 [Conidiobolus coronatus NRRL 28638]|eukprot:KXN72297.1 hypothetical protein CONCODRAFT_77883 [Conidiobolus coronatus NRRL 28638]